MWDALTKPTRGRLGLWLVLALVWFLFLPQALFEDPGLRHLSATGAVFWAAVLAWLLTMAAATARRWVRER